MLGGSLAGGILALIIGVCCFGELRSRKSRGFALVGSLAEEPSSGYYSTFSAADSRKQEDVPKHCKGPLTNALRQRQACRNLKFLESPVEPRSSQGVLIRLPGVALIAASRL